MERNAKSMVSMNDFHEWFLNYIRGFEADNGMLEPLLALKREHSYNVSREAGCLAADLSFGPEKTLQAEILGLLHDVGRFPQFRDYGTFYDAASIDHGELGWKTVLESRVLEPLDEGDRLAILDGIRYHNRKEIPRQTRPSSLGMVRLIRDADKLDVFELVHKHLEEGRIRELLPRIPETTEVSENLVEALIQTGRASYSQVRSVGDFLLVQLSWVFDMNYPPSFRKVLDRGVIERIERRLPPGSTACEVVERARAFARSSALVEEGRSR
jgi:hypothetical protein